ncbi:MAG: Sir2 family NAD-dependent protein deacetylase [Bacteroidales bacterium]|jgi:NAD-dependent deacetylase|nr:Sir2 family NAD-dependent protein deacetylase [Bacteroidales bacterium]
MQKKKSNLELKIDQAVKVISTAREAIAYTGAGISVESGIPPFRGEDGLWNKYDPKYLDLDYFLDNPYKSWIIIKQIFYDFFGRALPNAAHTGLSELERLGLLKAVITQNIDNLHTDAGSKEVYEFHGNSRELVCLKDHSRYQVAAASLEELPPRCELCGEPLKPDFIFFGEQIPETAYRKSFERAKTCDVVLIVGSTGEVVPAAYVPQVAKQNGAYIIEINPKKSYFTDSITDLYLEGKASLVIQEICNQLKTN